MVFSNEIDNLFPTTSATVFDSLKNDVSIFGSKASDSVEQRIDSSIDKIVEKYLEPFKPQNTKPKTPAQQKRSDERKAKDREEIQAMLNDEFIYDVISYSVSKDEAQMRLEKFLRS